MLFATPDGEGADIPTGPKRAKIRLDTAALRLLRAATFTLLHDQKNVSVEQIAEMLNFSERTVKSDLAFFREHAAKLAAANA